MLVVGGCATGGELRCSNGSDGEYLHGKHLVKVEMSEHQPPGSTWQTEEELEPFLRTLDRLTEGRAVSYGYQYGEGVQGWIVLLGDDPPAAEVVTNAADWRIDVYYGARHTMGELLDTLDRVEVTGSVLFAEIDEKLNAVRIAVNQCDLPRDQFSKLGDVNIVVDVREGEEPPANMPGS